MSSCIFSGASNGPINARFQQSLLSNNERILSCRRAAGEARLHRRTGAAGHVLCLASEQWMPAYRLCLGIYLFWTVLLVINLRVMLVLDLIFRW